jgi:uncharacterized protein (DUF58 family)
MAVTGWWWHYEEFVVVGVGTMALVAVAVWSARRPFRVEVTRRLGSLRVARGDDVNVVYRVANDTGNRSIPVTIVDRVTPHLAGGDDPATVRVDVGSLDPATSTEVHAAFPTRRRGIYDVGPWELERVDPFGLAVGRRAPRRPAAAVTPVIVHPRIHDLLGPSGFMHTVESEAVVRRAATDPLSGFVALREYVDGDDPRLIHWPTTARTGSLMVREHVELRRPQFTVVLDAATHVGTADDFEEMVDAAASMAVHSLRQGLDVVVRTTSRLHPGTPRSLRSDGPVLELLTPVGQVSGHQLASVPELFQAGLDHSAVVVVTGPAGPSSRFAALDRMMVVRIGHDATTAPGVAMAAATAAEFARRWTPWAA